MPCHSAWSIANKHIIYIAITRIEMIKIQTTCCTDTHMRDEALFDVPVMIEHKELTFDVTLKICRVPIIRFRLAPLLPPNRPGLSRLTPYSAMLITQTFANLASR